MFVSDPSTIDLMAVCASGRGLNDHLGIPLIVHGAPGMGKSTAVAELGRVTGRPVRVIRLLAAERADVGGIPCRVDDEDGSIVMRKGYLSEYMSISKLERPIILVDDLNSAPKDVMLTLLGLIPERVFDDGSSDRPQVDWREASILLATNTDRSSVVSRIPANVAGRMIHHGRAVVDSDAARWDISGESQLHVHPKLDDVQRRWPEAYASNLALKQAFLQDIREHGESAYDTQPNQSIRSWEDYVFRSPRAYDLMVRAKTAADILAVNPRELIVGAVGPGTTDALYRFIGDRRIPTPGEMLAGTVNLGRDQNPGTLMIAFKATALALRDAPQASIFLDRVEECHRLRKDGVTITTRGVRTLMGRTDRAMPSSFDLEITDGDRQRVRESLMTLMKAMRLEQRPVPVSPNGPATPGT